MTKSTEWNQGNALQLGTFLKPNSTTPVELLPPVVNVTQGKNTVRYAWWISDEGTKARVDLAAPKSTPTNDREKLTRAQAPLEPGMVNLGDTWKDFGAKGALDKLSLISLDTASLATNDMDVPLEYFNDLTSGGFGVPSDVVDGGMKVDLSLVFDKSQQSKKYAITYFGADTPSNDTYNSAKIARFTHDQSIKPAKDPKKFFLSDSLSKNGTTQVGPNWGILWNYATLWQNVSGQQIPVVGLYPAPWSDLRNRNWLPYTNSFVGNFQNDLQHTNTPVAPVVSTLQMGFRLKSAKVKAAAGGTPGLYKAQVEIKPVIGIWNPYDVTIKAQIYRFDWALYPFFRLNYSRPGGADARLTRLWLRREWSAGSGDMPSDTDQNGGRFFQMETEAVDLYPGETRLFSVTEQIDLKIPGKKMLKSAWSEKGAFVVDLTYKTKDDKQKDVYVVREIPEGHHAWFGDIVLQGTYATGGSGEDNFNTEFPGFDPAKYASTWFTMKAGDSTPLFRTTDLWNSAQDAAVKVPEPVVSGWKGGATDNTTKEKFPIEDIAGDKYVPHIATWSFFTRTTNQLQQKASDQRIRGWADTNPRTTIAMPAWDGSRVVNGKREGWNFNSNLIGGWHDNAAVGVVGDGKNDFPNRGLIGEGGKAEPEPQISDVKRYSGYSGASNTPTGQANSIVYDVPRGPLVSIGQFQHAQLSRYNFEPGFVVGNSYANSRIPLKSTFANNFAGFPGMTVADVSYEVNKKLWDKYFFSSLGIDCKATSGSKFDSVFNYEKLTTGVDNLPNPRMLVSPLSGDTSIDKIIADASARAPEPISARILVKGAFNVNSTSKTAWKAVLSSMSSSQLPTVSQSGGSGSELDLLAEAIVEEVKARGPFRSMAEFVNRNPNGDVGQQRKGALQAALDLTINNTKSGSVGGKTVSTSLPSTVGGTAGTLTGSQFSAAAAAESEAVGSAAYLMQGDLLQSLAPVLQVRSDNFRIRTCGESVNPQGKVVARAWCEAYVQRTCSYVDPEDESHLAASELKSDSNKTYCRAYRLVSFRWLNSAEL